MAQESVTEFLLAVKQDEALKEKLKAATNLRNCVKIAEKCGHRFTTKELQLGLSELSEEELAEIINPGIGPRRHLNSM